MTGETRRNLLANFTLQMEGVYYVIWATNAQLIHKLSHFYMFRHYRVFLRKLEISTLPSYTSFSSTAVCYTIQNEAVSNRFYAGSHYTHWNLNIKGTLKHENCPIKIKWVKNILLLQFSWSNSVSWRYIQSVCWCYCFTGSILK